MLKAEKNSEEGGWVKPQLRLLLFFGDVVFFVFFFIVLCVVLMLQKKMERGVDGWGLANPSFSRIFLFFLFDKTP